MTIGKLKCVWRNVVYAKLRTTQPLSATGGKQCVLVVRNERERKKNPFSFPSVNKKNKKKDLASEVNKKNKKKEAIFLTMRQ